MISVCYLLTLKIDISFGHSVYINLEMNSRYAVSTLQSPKTDRYTLRRDEYVITTVSVGYLPYHSCIRHGR